MNLENLRNGVYVELTQRAQFCGTDKRGISQFILSATGDDLYLCEEDDFEVSVCDGEKEVAAEQAKQTGNFRQGQRIKLSNVTATVFGYYNGRCRIHIDGQPSGIYCHLEAMPEWQAEAIPVTYETGQVYRVGTNAKSGGALFLRVQDGFRRIYGDGRLGDIADNLGEMVKVS